MDLEAAGSAGGPAGLRDLATKKYMHDMWIACTFARRASYLEVTIRPSTGPCKDKARMHASMGLRDGPASACMIPNIA
jgi:hypothetical protein